MADYEPQQEQVLEEYHVRYRPEGTDMNPVVPEVVSDGVKLERLKKGTTAGIRHGLATASIDDLMQPRIRRFSLLE